MPTWTARADGPEGEFLRSASLDKNWPTSSGYMNCVSASGKLLGGRPSLEILDAFHALPENERKPGAVKVEDLPASQRLVVEPPEGGLILKVHARFLAHGEDGNLRYAQGEDFPLLVAAPEYMNLWRLFLQANTEYMWLTEAEWQSLVPRVPAKGSEFAVPKMIGERMARFHLTPRRAVTSEGGILSKRDVRDATLTLTVDDVTPQRLRMVLQGHVHTGSVYDADKATTPNGPLGFGFETPLHGILEYDRAKQVFTRVDIIAIGEVWGRWGDANGESIFVERPGREPFAFAFELVTDDSPSNRIPPGGNGRYVTSEHDYFGDAQ